MSKDDGSERDLRFNFLTSSTPFVIVLLEYLSVSPSVCVCARAHMYPGRSPTLCTLPAAQTWFRVTWECICTSLPSSERRIGIFRSWVVILVC